jgi:hypothetical protein
VTGTGAAASATLALLVLICAFVAVAVPRASLGYRTAVLQRTFAAVPATQKTVLGDGDLSELGQQPLSAAQLERSRVQLAAGLHRDGLPLAGPSARWQWSGLATGTIPLSGATADASRHMAQPELELLYRSTLARQSVLVAGSLPTRLERRGASSATFQVAVTTATAARLGVHVGSRLRTAGQTLVVTGIVRPAGPASAFWTVDPIAVAPQLTQLGTDAAPFWSTARSSARPRCRPCGVSEREPLHALWSFPLDLRSVTADRPPGCGGNSRPCPTCPRPAQ